MSRAGNRLGFVVLAAALLSFALGSTATAASENKAVYIVVLHDSVASAQAVADEHAVKYHGKLEHVYEAALKGYAVELHSHQAEKLAAEPQVAYVEPDAPIVVDTTQTGATWGLDRIDQRNRPLSGTYTYFNTGAGVKAYVIDTGIRFGHTQFGGRAISGTDKIDGGTADDCNGHGTHVAGTVGGSTYGVAKSATLVAVRVLNCNGSGTTSGVIAGVDWVTANHGPGQPAVANMSLGGGASSALDTAVRNSIADGVSYAVAAGNGNFFGQAQNACNYSPARVSEAMTISATDSTDTKASWANFGNCVDWFAPGVSITSAWSTSSSATRTISGTSMATPHTAGVAALYLQGNPGASPSSLRTALYNNTTKNIVTGTSTVNRHLLFTNY
ncbi:MAG: S8 family peptidase [Gaiellaceae bacterium]